MSSLRHLGAWLVAGVVVPAAIAAQSPFTGRLNAGVRWASR